MLGLLAHTRIRRSKGWIRGERMAVIAMVLGSVLALVQMLVLEQFRESQVEAQRSLAVAAVRTSLDRGTAEWPASAMEAWATTASMDAAALEAGVAELETELGSFVSLRLGDARAAGPGQAAGRVWSGFLSAGGTDRPAVIDAVVGQLPRAGAMGILPGTLVRLRAIRVMLRDGRELVIGQPFVVGEDASPDSEPVAEPGTSDAAGDSDTSEPTDPAGDSEQEGG